MHDTPGRKGKKSTRIGNFGDFASFDRQCCYLLSEWLCPWETETWMLLAGGAAGGFLGALLLDKLSAGWVNVLFTVLILISGIRMLFA